MIADNFAIRLTEVSAIGATPELDTKVVGTNDAISHPFTVEPLHLVFQDQPAAEFVGDPVSFKVAVEDFEDKIVTTEDANQIDIKRAVLIGNSGKGGYAEYESVPISGGVATFAGDTGVVFDTPGTYGFIVQEADVAASTAAGGGAIIYVQYCPKKYSKVFRVLTG